MYLGKELFSLLSIKIKTRTPKELKFVVYCKFWTEKLKNTFALKIRKRISFAYLFRALALIWRDNKLSCLYIREQVEINCIDVLINKKPFFLKKGTNTLRWLAPVYIIIIISFKKYSLVVASSSLFYKIISIMLLLLIFSSALTTFLSYIILWQFLRLS